MALDIAVLQSKYGVKAFNAADTVGPLGRRGLRTALRRAEQARTADPR